MLADAIVQVLEKRESVDGFKVIALGCGASGAEKSPKFSHLTGVDIYPYFDAPVDKFIQHDVKKIREIIPDKSYDLVFCLDIIEHLTRREGKKLIKDAEAIATKAIVFYTPLRWDKNCVSDKTFWAYGNPHNVHKSLWGPEDFKGYEILKPFPQDVSLGFLAVKWL